MRVSENDIIVRITLNPLQFITKAAHSKTLVLLLLIKANYVLVCSDPSVTCQRILPLLLRAAGLLGKAGTNSGDRSKVSSPQRVTESAVFSEEVTSELDRSKDTEDGESKVLKGTGWTLPPEGSDMGL